MTHLTILEDKESDIFPVMDFILSKNGRRKILDPNSCQLVPVDIVVLEIPLEVSKTLDTLVNLRILS